MSSDLNQVPFPESVIPKKAIFKKPHLSAEDMEDLRAVQEGQKEHGGTPWADVKAMLNL